METVTLTDLAPILGVVLGSMLACVFAMMRYQHVDSTKTRELIYELIEKSNRENRELIEKNRELIEKNRELIEKLTRENRELIEKLTRENRELIEKLTRENRELIEKNHRELVGSLGEVRERLAHIEGYLQLAPPPYNDGNVEAA